MTPLFLSGQVAELEAEIKGLSQGSELLHAKLAEAKAELAKLRSLNQDLALEVENHRTVQQVCP